jgi:hypothetical protein
MTENISGYGQIVETVHLRDGTIRKIGFRSGKWIVQNSHERVAISKSGFLLYLEYSQSGRAYSYDLPILKRWPPRRTILAFYF